MTVNLLNHVQECDRQLRSSPSKLRSPAKGNNIASDKKEPRDKVVKTALNSKSENKLSEKELSFCLDLNEISDDSDDSSVNENDDTNLIKPITRKLSTLWRVSDSPLTKQNPSPFQKNKNSCEKLRSPSDRIKNMSPAKSEQLSKARRSLNLELCTESEKNVTGNTKSPLKIKLKRRVVDEEECKDVSPAKVIRTKTSTPTRNVSDILETPPTVKRKLRAREDIKLPQWRRVETTSPLKEIQSPKINSPTIVKYQTPHKTTSEVAVSPTTVKYQTPHKTISEVAVSPTTVKYQTPHKTTSKVAVTTPKSNKKVSFGTSLPRVNKTVGTPVSRKLEGRGFLTPTMVEKRKSNQISTPQGPLDQARVQLHISTVPKSLPCREKEFNNIHGFLKRKITDHAGGCMYISGVPGTGKTATVHAVVRSLQQLADDDEISPFDFVEVNGLRLTEPRQAYVRILQTLTGQKLTAEQAQRTLEKRFSGSTKRSTVLLVDELDYLCNRRQDVVYNILDWPSKRNSGLVVLTISNTMDLPERTLKGRVTSRMGLTRLMFQPYTHHQLQEIVLNRLAGNKSFHPDAVQLVARKVAAVSGDARRALDICRRSTELVLGNNTVTVSHVESALTQIFTGPRVLAILSCSKMDQLVLRSLRDETQRTGVDESNVRQVYYHLVNICSLEDCPTPNVGDVLRSCTALAALGLIVAEKGRPDIMRKLSLNVSSDDIHYALDC